MWHTRPRAVLRPSNEQVWPDVTRRWSPTSWCSGVHWFFVSVRVFGATESGASRRPPFFWLGGLGVGESGILFKDLLLGDVGGSRSGQQEGQEHRPSRVGARQDVDDTTPGGTWDETRFFFWVVNATGGRPCASMWAELCGVFLEEVIWKPQAPEGSRQIIP